MKTEHKFYFTHSFNMKEVPSDSVHLVVTSPPYPMIEMWDELFEKHIKNTESSKENKRRFKVFESMHEELDSVWTEVYRALIPGGFVCINIGDATRTINDHFALYPNHVRVTEAMIKIGFTPLPEIIWRKSSNAPNKFMGSGMLPAGAYVTQEHEYILIFRKGGKRVFKTEEEKKHRMESAFFWEERNMFFSDVWLDLIGTRQNLEDREVRKRSAAFPFELPYRIINMYSLKGDTVLDPFFGTGTTMLAAMTAGRNSIGYEIFEGFKDVIESRAETAVKFAGERISSRLKNHVAFVKNRLESGKEIKHVNEYYNFPVVTRQEKQILINELIEVRKTDSCTFEADYLDEPSEHFISDSEIKQPDISLQSEKKKTVKKGQLEFW